MPRIRLWLCLSLVMLLSSGARMGAPEPISTTLVNFPALIDGRSYTLEAAVYRPGDGLTHPLIVMNHGRNGKHPQRNPKESMSLATLNKALAGEGYVVMMLVRRGYGKSDGPDCELRETAVLSGLEAAKDIRAAVEYMRGQDYVQGDQVAVMGHSQGGWAALAAASVKIEGVLGTVNLCGGTNYDAMGLGFITKAVQEHWIKACGDLGGSAQVPTLWLYAENDRNHPPVYVRQMFASYQAAGGRGELLIKPPFGDNGHMIVAKPDLFLEDLLTFLARIGMGRA